MDLDPCFVRGLQLLHSRAPESADQLRALLEEVQTRVARSSGGVGKLSPANMSPRHGSANPVKRPYDSKYKDEPVPSEYSKKYQLDTGRSYPSSPTRSRDSDVSKRSDDSDLNDTAGLEMDLMNQLACVVCRNIGVTSGNQLQECSECGSLYHQECHTPPISEAERSDSRAIWVCTKCCDTGSNTATSGRSKLPPSSSSSSSIFSHSSSRTDRSDSAMQRRDTKSTSGSFSTLRSGYSGPGISTSSSASSTTMKSSSKSASLFPSSSGGRSIHTGGPAAPPANSMISAERRMQMMKKKAAAKLNEKRKT